MLFERVWDKVWMEVRSDVIHGISDGAWGSVWCLARDGIMESISEKVWNSTGNEVVRNSKGLNDELF